MEKVASTACRSESDIRRWMRKQVLHEKEYLRVRESQPYFRRDSASGGAESIIECLEELEAFMDGVDNEAADWNF